MRNYLIGNSGAPTSQATTNNATATATSTSTDDRYAAISGLDTLMSTDTVGKDAGFSLSSSNPNPFGGNSTTDSGSFQGSQWQQQPQTSVFGSSSMTVNPMSSATSSQGFNNNNNTSTTSIFSNAGQGQMQQSSFGGQFSSTQSFASMIQYFLKIYLIIISAVSILF